ncbi:DNA alkylation repair protein [Bifidobacterium moukalabense]|uniref:DNA alkylation repair protein n=1 Tax=Bifidobacterium moukalabense TaxID=1333651 RepID=UPI001484FA50|nr:DNA alkylation repair protein [Bifidobacterium moukalabense]
MECEAITRHLHTLADASYKAFNARLIPNVAPETMIGIRLPRLRSYAKELLQSDEDNGTHVVKDFLGTLPHALFEENMLHAMLLSLAAHSTDEACGMLDRFLPYVDNWAVCDTLSVKVFRSVKADSHAVLRKINAWTNSDHTYAIRYAVDLLMKDFLDKPRFDPEQLELIAGIRSDDYYVNMARAWYVATALAKQWDAAMAMLLPDAPDKLRLDGWTHNKSIQKACESRRITNERKSYLRTLKRDLPRK